jgi:hypothetical protein
MLVIVGAPTAASGAGYAAVFNATTGIVIATLTGAGNQFGFSVAINPSNLPFWPGPENILPFRFFYHLSQFPC